MHDLQLPLMILGLCLLVFLALPELRHRLRKRGNVPTLEQDRKQNHVDDPHAIEDVLVSAEAAVEDNEASGENKGVKDAMANNGDRQERDGVDDLLLLHLLAAGDTTWSIGQVAAALRAAGLSFGEMDIFHYPDPAESGAALFSIANMNEPGTLALIEAQAHPISGLVAFRRLSGDARDARACACMLRASRVCAKSIGAILCDSKMQPLSDADMKKFSQRFATAARTKSG
ncbi:MAG: cell division protein ZipA C-terminal FtsZ-binding domain-containing protein [Candidatus Porifericomitaceae bacterium WSBS_2022_MAG_OTU9]